MRYVRDDQRGGTMGREIQKIFRRALPHLYGQRGITLLLVMVLLSAILSISVGIFNVVVGEFRISGEVSDSFHAFYAADQGAERTYYQDFQQSALCTSAQQAALCTAAQSQNCYCSPQVSTASGACYVVQVSKLNDRTTVEVQGRYQCANALRSVSRRVRGSY